MRADIYDRLIAEAEKWGGVDSGVRIDLDGTTPICVIGMAQVAGIFELEDELVYSNAKLTLGFSGHDFDQAIHSVKAATAWPEGTVWPARVPLPLVFAELGITREPPQAEEVAP